MDMPKGWHSRGYLPHFNAGETLQMVTFREAGSLPRELVEYWRRRLGDCPDEAAKAEYEAAVEQHLDNGHGPAHLQQAEIATLVESALLHFDDTRYRLLAWVIMPNHVHALLLPLAPYDLTGILQSWKGWSAREANRILGRAGQFWAPDYFDRYIRDGEHLTRAAGYIETNPVYARLCRYPDQWQWGSARARREGTQTT